MGHLDALRSTTCVLPNKGEGAGAALYQGDVGASSTAQHKAALRRGASQAQQFGAQGAVRGPGLGRELSLGDGG